jgi:hypothetical protein
MKKAQLESPNCCKLVFAEEMRASQVILFFAVEC